MPLVRVDLPRGKPADYKRAIGDAIFAAMRATLNVPEGDRFQIFAERGPDDLSIDPNYLNIARSPEALIIQITLNEGRTTDQKRAFYKAVADGLQASVGLRREDVMINLVEVKKENWSFGNGEAPYA
ncbi:MAG: tautomerase family protein [Methylovirgula sp.]|nr:tautomerase family protein [Methylovirgula sp.]